MLVILVGAAFAVAFGWAVYHQQRGGESLGKLGRIALRVASLPEEALEAVAAKDPYLVAAERFDGQSGFNFSYPPMTRPDSPFLLINRHNPDLGLGTSELWDLDSQKPVAFQAWEVDPVWADVGPISELSNFAVDKRQTRYAPYHTLLLADGGLISQYTTPLVAADVCGHVGVLNSRYLYHHSIEQDADGNYWVPSYLEPKAVDLGTAYYLDDALTRVTGRGEVLFSQSVSKILMDNGLGYLLTGGNDFVVNDDPIHLNDIQPVLEDGPYFKRGDLFISLRHQSMLMLYRPEANKIIWYSLGATSHQHDINIISNHEISVFDNNTIMRDGVRAVDGSNRYMVYDFVTRSFTERFGEAMRAADVRTPTNGRAELLADGSLFVEESDFGRILALKQDGAIDWSYVNRDSAGELVKLTWSRLVPRALGESFLNARKEATCE